MGSLTWLSGPIRSSKSKWTVSTQSLKLQFLCLKSSNKSSFKTQGLILALEFWIFTFQETRMFKCSSLKGIQGNNTANCQFLRKRTITIHTFRNLHRPSVLLCTRTKGWGLRTSSDYYYEWMTPGCFQKKQKDLKNQKNFLTFQFPAYYLHKPWLVNNLRS